MSILTTRLTNNMLQKVSVFILVLFFMSACTPHQDVELRKIQDIIVNAGDNPTLQANAVLYNPNNVRMKLRKINVDVFVNGKKAGNVDQELKMKIPAKDEFSVPLIVNLNLKELGLLDTILSLFGSKRMKVHYKGSIKITYNGVPVKIPVDYEDEIRVKF